MSKITKKQKIEFAILVSLILIGGLFYASDEVSRWIKISALDSMSDVAAKRMSQNEDGVTSVAADFINIPIKVRKIGPDIYQATGVANTHLIVTETSHILFDTGLSLQVAKQIKAFEATVSARPLSHIIVSHSHADHTGGVKFWQRPETKIITHTDFQEEQRYLTELQPYFYGRNRLLFPFMPARPPSFDLLKYGGVRSDIVVGDFETFHFEAGGRKFEVIGTPGAEGADNIVLWMPKEKILFSGDTFGPIFPQFPNIFTMRGEKIRKPIEYIKTLNMLIELDPDMIVPSHRDPISDKQVIMSGLVKMRDAVQFVHDATIRGMNDAKPIYELMERIVLPPELALSQEHGRVSWAVKSIWEYYATWFHFDKTTELYGVPDIAIYQDLVALSGQAAMNACIEFYLDADQPVHALHLIEIAKSVKNDAHWRETQTLHKRALEILLAKAKAGFKNSYEIFWINSQIRLIDEALRQNKNNLDLAPKPTGEPIETDAENTQNQSTLAELKLLHCGGRK